MAEDGGVSEPGSSPRFSLDDVDDAAFLARVKKLLPDLFAEPEQTKAAPTGDGIADKITAALEEFATRKSAKPAPPPEPIIQVIKEKVSWFLD
jgi:hypothetical protein